jgi:hypothetical protein
MGVRLRRVESHATKSKRTTGTFLIAAPTQTLRDALPALGVLIFPKTKENRQ